MRYLPIFLILLISSCIKLKVHRKIHNSYLIDDGIGFNEYRTKKIYSKDKIKIISIIEKKYIYKVRIRSSLAVFKSGKIHALFIRPQEDELLKDSIMRIFNNEKIRLNKNDSNKIGIEIDMICFGNKVITL